MNNYNRQRDYNGDRLLCPVCESPQLIVLDTRSHRGTMRRRRGCTKCEYKFYTMEIETDADCTIDQDIIDKFNSNIPDKWTDTAVVKQKPIRTKL